MPRIWDLNKLPYLNEQQHLDFQLDADSEHTAGDVVAVGGNLSPGLLLSAYKQGLFPWYNEGEEICWWSPQQRFVLLPKELHLAKSLRRSLRRHLFKHPLNECCDMRLTLDQAFANVIDACAQTPRPGQLQADGSAATWISPEMQYAYIQLHMRGYAHSVECWQQQMDGGEQLVGGLYGISLGRCFFGESMFSLVSDASKMAFAAWALFLAEQGFELIDCQQESEHMRRFGARLLPRSEFIRLLANCQPAAELQEHQIRQKFWEMCRSEFPNSSSLAKLLLPASNRSRLNR